MICTVIPTTLPHFSYTGFHMVFAILASKANTATVQLIKTCMHLCYQCYYTFLTPHKFLTPSKPRHTYQYPLQHLHFVNNTVISRGYHSIQQTEAYDSYSWEEHWGVFLATIICLLVTLALQLLCWMTTLSQITWPRMGVVLVYIINYWNLVRGNLGASNHLHLHSSWLCYATTSWCHITMCDVDGANTGNLPRRNDTHRSAL